MAQVAREYQVYLCFGLLELTPDGVYDSAVLLDRQSQVFLVQRKNIEKPPFVNGNGIEIADIYFGEVSNLICGDLLQDEVVGKIAKDIGLLIILMARSFDSQSPDLEHWEREEGSRYLEVVKKNKGTCNSSQLS